MARYLTEENGQIVMGDDEKPVYYRVPKSHPDPATRARLRRELRYFRDSDDDDISLQSEQFYPTEVEKNYPAGRDYFVVPKTFYEEHYQGFEPTIKMLPTGEIVENYPEKTIDIPFPNGVLTTTIGGARGYYKPGDKTPKYIDLKALKEDPTYGNKLAEDNLLDEVIRALEELAATQNTTIYNLVRFLPKNDPFFKKVVNRLEQL